MNLKVVVLASAAVNKRGVCPMLFVRCSQLYSLYSSNSHPTCPL